MNEREKPLTDLEALSLETMKKELEAKIARSGARYTFDPNHSWGQTFIVTNLRRQFYFDEISHWFFPRMSELNLTGDSALDPDRGPIIERARFSFKPKSE